MEKLKSMVPDRLKRMVADGSHDDLPSVSSHLLDFLLNLQQFHQMVRDLRDPHFALCGKSKDAALELKERGNKCYLGGDYSTALSCYAQALRVAPVDAADMNKNLVATLYMNRASLLHKTGLLSECLRDCKRALQISPSYGKAWYRRGKANAALGNYKDAMNDFNVAKMVEFSLGGKRQIETELKMIGDRFERRIQRLSKYNDNNLGTFDEPHQWALSCVTTPDKGRGMASQCSIPQASLVHKEEPYAIVISKSCRESHCHYCLNELPADAVPCSSCSLSLYCSEHCRIQAGGDAFNSCQEKGGIPGIHCNNLEEYIAGVTLCRVFVPDVGHFSEHKHECLGVNWPAVFPSDIVLAGRILVKCISQRDWVEDNLLNTMDLSHNYSQIAPESKLELHIYAILLLFCLQSSLSFELPLNGVTLSQAIILLSQIRLNSMAVVRMKSGDLRMPPNQYEKFSYNGDALTSCVEKVPVGQAIYKAGSLYNHSCKPNIHAYFCSRTLLIRTTEFVPPGSPLELSYGPQVGQWDCKDRLKFLEDKYSFQCRCRGCSALNLSDLVINAFCCTNPNCAGIVLDKCIVECELHKLKGIPISPDSQTSDPQTSDPSTELSDKIKNIDISNFAHLALELNDRSLLFQPGCCLKCGSHCGMEAAHEAMDKAWIYIKRLQDAIVSEAISSTTLTDALRALGVLRSVLHASNKHIAEAEDNIAQAFCFAGDLQSAGDHCKMSTKILETLYDPDHIVVGYELVKLSTIQLSLDDCAFLDSVSRLEGIFTRHYGPHMDIVFPYLQDLKRVACSFRKREE